MSDRSTDKNGNSEQALDMADVLHALIVQTADPSRVLEWHYWAQEPGILEFVRALLTVPHQVRAALQTFLSAAEDPESVSVFVDGAGTLQLFSPNAAKIMKTFFSEGAAGRPVSRLPS
jgi:hypothetical protein